MLERPDIQDERIVTCLQNEYGLNAACVEFLPLGADVDTAVYRLFDDNQTPYFLKLRIGSFDETSVALPRFLSDRGIKQLIAPLATVSGNLSGVLDESRTILYPFVEGRNGYETQMSERHWAEFGEALRRIHTAHLPLALLDNIRRETFSNQWREDVKRFLLRLDADAFNDPAVADVVEFLKTKRSEIKNLVERTQQLAQIMPAQSSDWIVCHSDIHAGNVLMADEGGFFIVDWDEPILAPKERDLMYIGAGLLASGRTPEEEENLFYRAYGRVQIDSSGLTYYRYERIIQDIAAYCEQLLMSNEGGADRARSLRALKSNFLPGGTIEMAERE
jgi:spectinomycin phosphotransferase